MQTRTVGGVELALVDRGAGSPIVLLHGFPLDGSMWNAQVDALAEHYRVIVPDLRGFGRSGATAGKVTMEQFADDLAGLLDALEIDEPIALGGLSMGGYVAFAFWRKYPDRLRSLMLLDTRAAADAPEAAAARLQTAKLVLREGPAPLVEGMLPRLFAADTFEHHAEVIESLERVMLGADPQAIAAAALGMAEREDFSDALSEIQCPTLVVVGEHDALSPVDEMAAIAREIPDARFVEVSAAGHMSPLEAPTEVTAAMLEFLAAT